MQQGRQPHKTVMTTSERGDYTGRIGQNPPPPEKSHQDKGKIKVILYMTNNFLYMRSGLEYIFFVRTNVLRPPRQRVKCLFLFLEKNDIGYINCGQPKIFLMLLPWK